MGRFSSSGLPSSISPLTQQGAHKALCLGSYAIPQKWRAERFECCLTRVGKSALFPQSAREVLVSLAPLGTDYSVPLRRQHVFDPLIEISIRGIPEISSFACKGAIRRQGVIRHDFIDQDHVAQKRGDYPKRPVGQGRNLEVPVGQIAMDACAEHG